MVDIKKSVKIYNHLMNGRILNRQILASHGAFEDNPLFSELMDNLEDYRRQYQMGGFSLIANADFAYLIKGDSYEIGKSEIAMKAYCLLLLLGKYLTTHNYTLSKLTSEKGGLSQADFHKIEAMPHTQEILERAAMGDDLFRNIKSILIERGIMFEKPSEQKFVLSNAGKAFFDELMMSFEDSDAQAEGMQAGVSNSQRGLIPESQLTENSDQDEIDTETDTEKTIGDEDFETEPNNYKN